MSLFKNRNMQFRSTTHVLLPLLILLSIIGSSLPTKDETTTVTNDHDHIVAVDAETPTLDDDNTITEDDENQECASNLPIYNRNIPTDCEIVMAPKSTSWGIYTLVPKSRGDRVIHGDVVIQWIDDGDKGESGDDDIGSDSENVMPLPATLRTSFTMDAQYTGGQFEGDKGVTSFVPGIGSIATIDDQQKNILPFVPMVDEAELTRQTFAGAGAISHYHNFTWFISQRVEAGGELFRPSFGAASNGNIDDDGDDDSKSSKKSSPPLMSQSPSWLRENGYCLDNVQPKRKSRLKGAGRGVFANRNMKENDVLLPAPVVAIDRSKVHNQLLQNYCFGHPNSTSTLLYPYGPTIHLVNHYNRPNAKLVWSSSTAMLLQLVALRDIPEGEEITINYGSHWEDSWWKHVHSFETRYKRSEYEDRYVPAAVIDDASKTIRIESEQDDHPYESNVLITCFYKYSDRTESEKQKAAPTSSVITYRWQMTRGIYDLKNLRPCTILKRKQTETGRSAYAVRIHNRPGLSPDEMIPEDQLHIVTHIPRSAIRFMDRPYTTDQHLDWAFRHWIGLDDFFEF